MHFDGTITLGAILTAVVIAITIATTYIKGTRWLSSQISRFETTLQHHGQQLSLHSARMDGYEERYLALSNSLERLVGRMEASDRRGSSRKD